MKRTKTWLATLAIMGIASSNAFALPLGSGRAQFPALKGEAIENIAVVCNAWGQCWQAGPYYGGGGYYGGYGGYYGGYRGHGGGWNRGWGGGWGHRDWDGRDWHGGRWGHFD
jgi:hypothetical protein